WDYEPGTLIMQPSQTSVFQGYYGKAPLDAQQYPNSFSRGNLHGALGFDLGRRVDISGSVAYTGSNQRRADINSLLLNGATGLGYPGTSEGWTSTADAPGRLFFDTPTQRVVHLTG